MLQLNVPVLSTPHRHMDAFGLYIVMLLGITLELALEPIVRFPVMFIAPFELIKKSASLVLWEVTLNVPCTVKACAGFVVFMPMLPFEFLTKNLKTVQIMEIITHSQLGTVFFNFQIANVFFNMPIWSL